MKILVSGSHGLVGSALIGSLKHDDHEVLSLVRRAPRSDSEVEWLPEREGLALSRAEGIDIVVHLAGESIAEGRWTEGKKQRIRDSRVKGTTLLSKALARLQQPPKTFFCASAIGYYGDRGDEVLTEDSAPGNGFLASVCREWEGATQPAAEKGVRVLNARFGIILSAEGGALAKMVPPFRMGVGGRVGSGKQWMSWIALDDVVAAIRFAIDDAGLRGPVNYVAPNAVTNSDFTRALGKALSRPTLFPVPEFAARLAFGEMADALLLSSQRVEATKLKLAGFQFKYSQLDAALKHILARSE